MAMGNILAVNERRNSVSDSDFTPFFLSLVTMRSLARWMVVSGMILILKGGPMDNFSVEWLIEPGEETLATFKAIINCKLLNFLIT